MALSNKFTLKKYDLISVICFLTKNAVGHLTGLKLRRLGFMEGVDFLWDSNSVATKL
jgi:hypothetical protein